MRGESKYHYVDLALIEDHQEIVDPHRLQHSVDVSSTTAEKQLIQRQVTTGASFAHTVFTLRFTKGRTSPTDAFIQAALTNSCRYCCIPVSRSSLCL